MITINYWNMSDSSELYVKADCLQLNRFSLNTIIVATLLECKLSNHNTGDIVLSIH